MTQHAIEKTGLTGTPETQQGVFQHLYRISVARLLVRLPLRENCCRTNLNTRYALFYHIHVFQKALVGVVHFTHRVQVDYIDAVCTGLNDQWKHMVFIIKNLGVAMVCDHTQQKANRFTSSGGKMAHHAVQVGFILLGRKYGHNSDAVFFPVLLCENSLCTIQGLGHHVAECAIVFIRSGQAHSGI
mgnify:CR=1 FL=1